MVGAVLVNRGELVGAGYHHQAGFPHAEVNALEDAGENARGATLYVTLEPCSTRGRTPPCTDAIRAAGIARVVVGCLDANPRHCGGGIAILRAAGIRTTTGVLEPACRRLNESFFWWIAGGRPFVTLKMAMTLDGKIATRSGQSKWITGAPARRRVQRLRQWADAVMVGGETVLQDDPELRVRTPSGWSPQPRVFVWTGRPLPPAARICRESASAPPETVKPVGREEWLAFLRKCGDRRITALLIEGGGELAAAALQARIVNRVEWFVAPKILGGRHSRPVVGGEDPDSLEEALPLREITTRRIGDDLLITGYCADVYRFD
jgi:diaminohydroxyphosphoribosylaminopyrimidine deaminase/5-amino-6-(5-phosphoribosylamino)uracil reductase